METVETAQIFLQLHRDVLDLRLPGSLGEPNYFCPIMDDKAHADSAWAFVRLICLVPALTETECFTWCRNQQFFIDSQSNEKQETKITVGLIATATEVNGKKEEEVYMT